MHPIFFLVSIFNRIGVSLPLSLCFCFVLVFDRIFLSFMFSIFRYLEGPYFLLASLMSKVQRKPGVGGKTEEAGGPESAALRQGGSDEQCVAGSSQRTQVALARLSAALRQARGSPPRPGRLVQIAQASRGLTGHPVQPAQASLCPSDLLDLGSRPEHRAARAFARLAKRRALGLQHDSSSGFQPRSPGGYRMPGLRALPGAPFSLV